MIRWSLAVLVVIAVLGYGSRVREAQLAHDPLLPMTFAHADHVAQSCITCHHNYVDDNDLRSCLDCHKQEPEVRALIEPMFHELCMGCHIEQALLVEDAGPPPDSGPPTDSGPPRRCQGCHVADDRP